jgi:arginyl-tRNA synthetase
MHSADAHMDFDLDLAKEQSMKNPVYYAQYASARIHSILAKFKIQKAKFKITDKNLKINLKLLNTKDDINLMRVLARFPEIVEEAAENRNPSVLARYAIDLARTFHNFYEKERILGVGSDLILARLELIKAAKIIFENLFKLLGISIPKRM